MERLFESPHVGTLMLFSGDLPKPHVAQRGDSGACLHAYSPVAENKPYPNSPSHKSGPKSGSPKGTPSRTGPTSLALLPVPAPVYSVLFAPSPRPLAVRYVFFPLSADAPSSAVPTAVPPPPVVLHSVLELRLTGQKIRSIQNHLSDRYRTSLHEKLAKTLGPSAGILRLS